MLDFMISTTSRASCSPASSLSSSFALASVKAAFNARHGGVSGLGRMAHDLLLRGYLDTRESKELGAAFAERRAPDPDEFGQ